MRSACPAPQLVQPAGRRLFATPAGMWNGEPTTDFGELCRVLGTRDRRGGIAEYFPALRQAFEHDGPVFEAGAIDEPHRIAVSGQCLDCGDEGGPADSAVEIAVDPNACFGDLLEVEVAEQIRSERSEAGIARGAGKGPRRNGGHQDFSHAWRRARGPGRRRPENR